MYRIPRRCLLLAAATLLLAAQPAVAQSGKTSTLIVPYPPGSAFDNVARQIQGELGKSIDRTLVVENVPGASGSIGAQRLLGADPSAPTMMIGSANELALPPLTLSSVRYKPEDFRMVAQLTSGALALLARPNLPANNVGELVAYGKRPGAAPLTFGSTGNGSIFHIVGVDFGKRLALPMTHVPYKGGAPAVQDLIGGQIDMVFLPLIPTYIQMAKEGRIKVLAMLSPDAHAALPDVPSVDRTPELRGMHYAMWTGLFVSAKAKAATVAELNKAANLIVGSPGFRAWVGERGNQPGQVLNPEQAAAFFDAESRRFERLARDINLERE